MKKRFILCFSVAVIALMVLATVSSFAGSDHEKKPVDNSKSVAASKEMHEYQITDEEKSQFEEFVNRNADESTSSGLSTDSYSDPVTYDSDGNRYIELYYPEPGDTYYLGARLNHSYMVYDTWVSYYTNPHAVIFDSNGNIVSVVSGPVANVDDWTAYSGYFVLDPSKYHTGAYEFWIFNVPCNRYGTPVDDWGSWSGVPYVRVPFNIACNHIWDAGVITVPASCTQNGVKTYTCSQCRLTKTEAIPAMGHSFIHEVMQPGVGIAGREYDKCTRCGITQNDRIIPALNPKATSITKLIGEKSRVTVKWKKTGAVSGYEIQCALNSSFTSGKKTAKVNKGSTASKKVAKLKAGKKYYVRVRTYKNVNGQKYYSAWSKAKTVKTK